MARKKIREFDAKKIIVERLNDAGHVINHRAVLVDDKTNWEELAPKISWLLKEILVVKPDQLFGKRKKNGLVLANVSYEEVKRFILDHLNQEKVIDNGKGKKTKGKLTDFIIEPFVEHKKEYYLALVSKRENDLIYFSENGGIDIEDNWDFVKSISINTLEEVTERQLSSLSQDSRIKKFVKDIFSIFKELDFTYLEFNPFTFDNEEKIVLLDTVAIVDDCSSFKNMKEGRWGDLSFPQDFGKERHPKELEIEEMDRNSGASLKLTVLNQQGRIWNILGGGGASIIYLDMIANLSKGTEIANYGEASGNPSANESYEYAKSILEMMITNSGKILFIVGGIANFTDVKNTFAGYIKALGEYGEKLKENKTIIFVRRGGPNYEEGLRSIKETCDRLGLRNYVHGPETSMPRIIEIAKEWL